MVYHFSVLSRNFWFRGEAVRFISIKQCRWFRGILLVVYHREWYLKCYYLEFKIQKIERTLLQEQDLNHSD